MASPFDQLEMPWFALLTDRRRGGIQLRLIRAFSVERKLVGMQVYTHAKNAAILHCTPRLRLVEYLADVLLAGNPVHIPSYQGLCGRIFDTA